MKLSQIVFISLLILASSTKAEKLVDITITPQLQYLSGNSDYELFVEGQLIDEMNTPVTWSVKSLLEFPLNTALAGLSIELAPSADQSRWSLETSFMYSLLDPGGKMKDSDWDGYEPYYSSTMFSFTESDVKQDMFIINSEISYRVKQFQKTTISLIIGYKYQKIKQNIIGYDGWQMVRSGYTFSDPIFGSGNEPAIDYEISFKQPRIGLKAETIINQLFSTTIKAAYAPTFFNDIDDHLIRKKISTADGNGKGLIGSLNLKRNFSTNNVLTIEVTYVTFSTNGYQKQIWYEDIWEYNPDTGVNELIPEGSSISGIPHKVISSQLAINIGVGFRF